MQHNFDLDTPLLQFSNETGAPAWTIRQAVEGVAVWGSMGSGKTSGVCRHLALTYLMNGFGGLFMTSKPDDADLYKSYCERAGRTDDVIVIEPGCRYHFNVIDFEARYDEPGKSYTQNLVDLLTVVVQASAEKSEGRGDDPFWAKSLRQLITHVINISLLAYGRVSVEAMYDIAISAPKSDNAMEAVGHEKTPFQTAFEAARDNVNKQLTAWKETWTPEQAARRKNVTFFEADMLSALPDARTLKMLDQFFNETYRNLSDKTRSIIDFSFSGFLFTLLQEPMYSLFCQHESNYTPNDCLNGKIIILNLPVKIYNEAGRDLQTMFKLLYQRAVERRNVNQNPRCVFLIGDEAQFFVHPKDQDCQTTARSSRLATVYATQNLPNYYGAMAGEKSEYKVKSFLATLNTKFFCSNNCMETNKFASDLIGQGYTEDPSQSATMSGQFSVTRGMNYRLEHLVRPEHFQRLKGGGPLNSHIVECFMHTQGFQFPDGLNFRKIAFSQL